MEKRELIYEGKGKKMYATDDANLLIAEFKDDLTAFNAQKRGKEDGKGALNNKISTQLFKILKEKGIATHLVETLSDTEQLVKKCEIVPIEVVVRNIATGSLSKRLGLKEGMVLPFTLVEFYYKNDELNDPIVTDEHCLVMGLVKSEKDLETLRHIAREINSILFKFFEAKGLKLVDFKVEFGIDKDGNILLADEISPDSCRFWDAQTNEKLDKDRFRQGIGEVKVAYEEVLRRILS
ncbi:phosphoribosylaminoimidazolesuccinocarboxamide synthase [Campylobacter sp. RM9344]|uniref:Phosphoribosylaminoimidazole-succinocarboxamide synthase n=1 Tax=Campylobacter californiensis TaxID=1032243 RepID=A0AAW3ZS24_9BACT|nr:MULTISPECIES: phosphoribosylaminoimidazolesuccinocarboxamide synthase [unclassified Campylobacter]MBE2984292.1 phosphoribosylaminoimidazolesuccinocarboxamide synthase [Campylobacter sp. RM6883]MBE2994841.1 phosphoribosylaminoimidazolesuccinocarboxamide synthase [Campylobacter sp. RM6913]MBE3029383.1 phosphoribosylaminoimidazolesuccinocarboxamide synthase [Campylobacter sp. RM9344]MBE3607972.1 phosphoribosylaminoimidazolesuccinocarboxamide synthase [Campylobacter sp. RM9337]QCD50775.1 phosph